MSHLANWFQEYGHQFTSAGTQLLKDFIDGKINCYLTHPEHRHERKTQLFAPLNLGNES